MERHPLFVGIDVSKLKHDIAIMNKEKKILGKPFVIKDDYAGYQDLLNKLETTAEKQQSNYFCIGLEATADYWKNIYYFLKRQSNRTQLTVINPIRTKSFAQTELRRAKTDSVNAKDIALFMVEKQPGASVDRPPLFDNIKDIDKRLYQLNKYKTMLVNRLRIELTKVAPEIEKNFLNMQGLQILALLEHYPTAEQIAKASVDELAEIHYGQKGWNLPISFVKKMKNLAQNSIAYKSGPGAGDVVESLVRSIGQTQQELQYLQKQVVELFKKTNKQDSLLASIPTITLQTAILFEAYIGDINRFSNSKQIVAYFGMNPTVNQSGKSRRASYLQKKGNPIVRQKLFMATLNMIRNRQEPIYSFYVKLVDAGKPKLVAVCAAMRKLLTIIFGMLKNNQTFKDQN